MGLFCRESIVCIRSAVLAGVALCLLPASVRGDDWTRPPVSARPSVTVVRDPSRTEFSYRTPAVLRQMGYRVRAVWSVPGADEATQRRFAVLVVERIHFTTEQYDALRAWVRNGGGLVLIGYGANWLDADRNQTREPTDPEIVGEDGAGGLVEVVGAARVGATFLLKRLQPAEGDPIAAGVEAVSWDKPAMAKHCNVVTLQPTTGTVACRMVRQKRGGDRGPGEVDEGMHALVVRRECGRGRAVWVGWTGIVGAARKGNAAAVRLLQNAIAWAARGADVALGPDDGKDGEAQLWQPTPGRYLAAFRTGRRPRSDNVQALMCHFNAGSPDNSWCKVIGPPAEFAAWLAEHHVEIVRINVAARLGTLYASKVDGMQEWRVSGDYRRETGRDMLTDLLTELHKRGIKLYGDYNHLKSPGKGAAPDVGLPRAVGRDGRADDTRFCWLSPEFTRRTCDLVAELFTRYEMDGLMVEDDHMPVCFCERCLEGFARFCRQRGATCVDPRTLDPKKQPTLWRLFGRYRAQCYYEQVLGPMRRTIHRCRPGATLAVWVGRWMRETGHGASRAGMAPFVDLECNMAYVDPPGVADAVWSDLGNLPAADAEAEEGAAMRPEGPADFTVRGLTAALESGSSVIGVYPEFDKKARECPGYEGMAHVFARAEAMWADRYERQLAGLGDVVFLCNEDTPLPRDQRVALARAGLCLRQARLYDDGRRVADLKSLLTKTQAVIAATDLMLTDEDLVELERFVRAGGGLLVTPQALTTRPEFLAGDIVARCAQRTESGSWLMRLGVTLGDSVEVHWMALRAGHAAVRGAQSSVAIFGPCRRVSAAGASSHTVGRDQATEAPVLCARTLDQGRLVCFGGSADGLWDTDVLPRLCRWLARTEDVRVESVRTEPHRATVEFVNAGKERFAGLLGIALPAAAEAGQVTLNGKPVPTIRRVTWGSAQYVYVSASLDPGQTATLSIGSDRVLVP